MTTNTPVPSKNALRVLRQLAFSSTTVLGAVGGVCGLATLNHEARRRVKLAERVVATKTTLRSVSNGRGQTHVARMFEAAERGEDFTLDENKAHKRRRIRHHSTVAFDQWNGNDGDILALQHSLQILSHQPTSRSSELQHVTAEKRESAMLEGDHQTTDRHAFQSRISDLPPLEYRQPRPEIHKKFGTYRGPPNTAPQPLSRTNPVQDQKNSPSVERILAATQAPLKRDTHGVYARHTRQYATQSPRLEASSTAVRSSQAPALKVYEEAGDSPYLDFSHRSGQLSSDTQHQTSDTWIQADHESNCTRRSESSSASGTRSGVVSGDTVSNTTQSQDSSYASSRSVGVSLLSDDENAFAQWPGIPRLDEVLEDNDTGVDDPSNTSISQESVGPGRETAHNGYFTALYDASASHSKSDPDQASVHLQASHVEESGSQVDKNFRSNEVYAATATKASLTIPVFISKIIAHATTQVRILENGTGIPTDSNIAQAYEKIDSLLTQTNLEALCESFFGVKDKVRKTAVLRAMTKCLDLDTPSSLIDAEILYYAFNRGYIVTAIDEPCQRLISHLLKDEKSYSRAASILFPAEATRTDRYQPSVQVPQKAASFYLAWFCEQTNDPDNWIEEVWKIISLAQQRGVPLHDRLIRSVIKSLVLANHPRLVHVLLKDIRNKTPMEITFLSYGVLIRNHAVHGNWPQVRQILDKLHSDGLSRTRPVGFSMLFQDVLEVYLRQKPLNQAYDYLIDATGSLGLVPTSTISTTIIVASLRQERYDLIQEWVEFVRQLFPAIDIGTGSAFSAWRVAQLWKDQRSSCEDIERGCQAMAYGALRDPFSPAFRGVALGAVERDLRKRICVANELWQHPLEIDMEQYLANMNLKDMIRFVNEYSAKHPSSDALPLRQREQYKDLLRQLQAVTRLNILFGGEVSRQKLPSLQSPEVQKFKAFIPTTNDQDPAEAALEEKVHSSKFPDRFELWSMLSDIYVGKQHRGQKPGHSVLEYLIPRMTRTERMADALMILESMYDSPYVQGHQGTPFTQTLFGMWLHIAVELKNGNAISKALWALVDSGIDLDTDLLLLVRIVCDRKSSNKHLPDVERIEVTEECRYLMSKLEQRRWIRTGRKGKEDLPRFAEFRSWEERMRTTPRPLFR